MNHPGFYSEVRYCPKPDRGDAVNIGVIIAAHGLGMRVRMADRNEHVKRRFGAEAFDDARLTLAKDGLTERLKDVEPTSEALFAFGAAEARRLQVSARRPMVVSEVDGDLLEDRLHRAIKAARERLALGVDVAVEITPAATAKPAQSHQKRTPTKRRKRAGR